MKKQKTIRDVPYMGVTHVVVEAMKVGYRSGHPAWCHLGQGQPEVGPIAGAPTRISWITLDPYDHAYGDIGGLEELRQAIADHYNRLYRDGKDSRYKKENVTVACGGQLTLSRIFATLGEVSVGYRVPGYTAYEDMLDYHRHRLKPVAVPIGADEGFVLSADRLSKVIQKEKLGVFLLSNPCDPTGQLVRDDELKAYLTQARKHKCMLIMDEFYSHYVYEESGEPGDGPVSAAAYVGDPERDQVLIVDGLTKSFRYPGWRLGWALGPSSVIQNINRAASSIDGGPSVPVQRLALKALEPERADQENAATREVFSRKRRLMLEGLRAMGVVCEHEPRGTFYVWADISKLPKPLNDAEAFFRAGLERKVITVPGRFFDVNPGGSNKPMKELKHWVRFSFAPSEKHVVEGLERLGEMVQEVQEAQEAQEA